MKESSWNILKARIYRIWCSASWSKAVFCRVCSSRETFVILFVVHIYIYVYICTGIIQEKCNNNNNNNNNNMVRQSFHPNPFLFRPVVQNKPGCPTQCTACDWQPPRFCCDPIRRGQSRHLGWWGVWRQICRGTRSAEDGGCGIWRETVSCVNSFRGEEVIGQKRGYHGSILSIWEAGFKMN